MINLLKTISETLTKIGNWSYDRLSYGDNPDDEIPSKGEIRTIIIPEEVSEPDLDQFIEVGGRYTLATPFRKVTSNFPTVTFEASKIQGSISSPQYNFLSVSNANPRDLNNVIVKHSSLVVPSVLVPNKPENDLPNYDSQALMTADFANQTAGHHYSYTGSTSMWQYDGTATDSIDNYTEIVEVTGWETWGSKPSYLIVQGDAYLVGENNVNELDFVYYELIKIGGTSYADVVVVTNTAHTDMNADTNRVINNSIILANFNQNDNPVQPDSVINESIYADFFPFNVTRPEQASYVDLTGGNYSFDIGTNSNTVLARTTLEIAVSEQGQLAMNPDEITIISRANYRTSGSTQNRGIYISKKTLNGLDFMFFETSLLLAVSYIDTGGVSRTQVCDVAIPISPIDSGYWVFAVSIKWDGANTLVEYFCKSSDNSVAFQKLGPTDQRAERPNLVSDQIVFDRLGFASSTSRPISIDYMQVVPKALTEAKILTIANSID